MISEKYKIIYSKNRRSRVKVEKEICHRSSWNHFMLSNYHTTVKKSTAFDTEISTEIPIALKTPLSSRLNPLIFGLSVVGYSAMSCFSAPTYLDKGYLPNSLENAIFFSLHHPRGSGGVSAWKTRDNGARNASILSQSRDLLMKWSLLFQLITGFLPTLGWLSIPKSSCAFFVPHNFRILYFLTAL